MSEDHNDDVIGRIHPQHAIEAAIYTLTQGFYLLHNHMLREEVIAPGALAAGLRHLALTDPEKLPVNAEAAAFFFNMMAENTDVDAPAAQVAPYPFGVIDGGKQD